ncbi:hypothetical protein CFC21_064177 [Triticum aestivum]|uniref:Protein kinase domain-containing protein n=2 Tax=Triticum aestivum TaxID=4565 RepID=A0A3B6KCD7_WHEAT|nr:hypothetical protein CFC21_064177 [Triticum aestivum]
MSPMAWMLVLMLLPLAASASSALVLKPDCQARCGDLVVPYPFGIGAGCFRPGFEIACDRNTTPFLPDVTFKGHTPAEPVRVLNLNVTPRAQVRVMLPVAHECVDTARKVTARFDGKLTFNKWRVYRISNTANELFVLGCDTLIYAASRPRRSRFRHATSDPYSSGCVAYCNSAQDARDRRCNSIGCCHVNISRLLNNTKMWFEKWSRTRVDSTRPCDYAFIVEKNGYVFETAHLKRKPEPDPDKRWSMPLWLDWAIRNRSNSMWCPQAVKTREYACVSKHSDCANSTNGKGYICKCSNGYEGTPYLIDGCTEVTTGLIIGLSVSSGPTILILLLTTKIIIRKLKNQKEQKLRQKFFNQNRGQLLQKLVSHRSDIAERMIIPLRELEKATNKFHPTRKLGGGGHGTVYKGILSDLHVVAIKRSNIEVKSEINEFINEVSILSQINHRNIVKLFGCCLETEVPLLAYEFISNGTLCDYLHKKPLRSLPWQEILRIALEIGRALSYLHSGLSVPIIHRDIKSTNILLDDALTAKVCDFGASRYIPRDKTTITTVVQGMLGYLDPTYFYCGRLTEKSDVYSFGVILVELLTRKMPITRRSSSGDGLVAQFVELLAKGKLVDILDPQVMEEGGSQAEVVASLAMSCTKLRAEERPTMRSVEMTLEALQGPKERFRVQDGTYEGSYSAMRYTSPRRSTSLEKTSRQYSQEEEFVLSASYPR